MFKTQAVDELLNCLPKWANKSRTFEEDMELEISDAAKILVDHYTTQELRLWTGDFAALIDSPIDATTVRDMRVPME